ncbi:MAG: hypothetical protein C4520_14740 [Candidatus Abyssobacteria bacterium SURF_5]|uniref:Lipoprotein n=1 Tax=Abyssobacteria bacterium (strain SURF_5) TaxID=2093360 RepID=A0A3A4N9Q2_ABYX5|nr:MAG: hypothetical protein C4520_14740 [Candidatus Abyssubacteria bacterium SURF_5]
MKLGTLYEALLTTALAFAVFACSSTDRIRTPENPDPVIKGEITEEKVQQALQLKLDREIKFLQENSERFKQQVVAVPMNSTTYYYKYYDEFPEGPAGVRITVTPADSLSSAYNATATCRKVRYQTHLSKSRGKAAENDDFTKDEGVQKNSYIFDGSIWRLRSSIFEVTKTSVYNEDQWVASRDRIRRVEEEKPEYFVDKLRTLFGLLD